MTMLAGKQFVWFVMVGILNTAFGYSTFALLIFLQLHYAVASFISTVLGILFNFKTTGRFVFNNRDNSLIFRFFCGYAVIYLLNVGFLYLLSGYQVNMYWAGAILIVPMAIISFALNKLFVFKKVRT